jgi:hypothetical protein
MPEQLDSVTFTAKGLTPERLRALSEFLRQASIDEIAAVRARFGDVPEVMALPGLEVDQDSFPVALSGDH